MKKSIGELVKDKSVSFQFYRQGHLHYVTDDGFEFTVPMEETGDATFPNRDKAIFFMRWIRKQLDLLEKSAQSV
jgi:hypothetical protein